MHVRLFARYTNKEFLDTRLRPGITTPLVVVGWRFSLPRIAIRPLRPNVTSSIKPEVHNISQYRQRQTEPRLQRICTKNFVKMGPEGPEICSRTYKDTQTDKLIAIRRSLPGRSNKQIATMRRIPLADPGPELGRHMVSTARTHKRSGEWEQSPLGSMGGVPDQGVRDETRSS